MSRRITIKDIGKMLSLTPSTVSRALNDHPSISENTKMKVREVASEFKYVPNLHAKYFRKKHSGLVALIVPEFNMYFMPDLLQAVQDILSSNGYSLIILHTNNKLEKEAEAVQHCMSWVVDGVLVVLSEETMDLTHFSPLEDTETPLVIMDKILPTKKFSLIRIDDYNAAAQAADLLVRQGSVHCLGLFAKPQLEITRNRMNGFTDTLQKRKSEENSAIVFNKIILDMAGDTESKLQEYSAQNGIPNGIFVMTDELMVASNRQYQRWCEVKSEQINLISISDGKAPFNYLRRVSHILHSGYEIGKAASVHLIQRITDHKIPAEEIIMKTRYVALDTL